ncbi:hypothetical protein TWF694_003740 [Orbilia ellipsospora]|uniref:Uncharacterized protein n=1 Tax=Orbilia ellipsospora TaxID=2528407 RepID=A0AAV9WZ48_9PEZI
MADNQTSPSTPPESTPQEPLSPYSVSLEKNFNFQKDIFVGKRHDLLRMVNTVTSECRRLTVNMEIYVQGCRNRLERNGVKLDILLPGPLPSPGVTEDNQNDLIKLHQALSCTLQQLMDVAAKVPTIEMKERYDDLYDRLEVARNNAIFEHTLYNETHSWFLTDTGKPLYLRDHQSTMMMCQQSLTSHCKAFVIACMGLKSFADQVRQGVAKIWEGFLEFEDRKQAKGGTSQIIK